MGFNYLIKEDVAVLNKDTACVCVKSPQQIHLKLRSNTECIIYSSSRMNLLIMQSSNHLEPFVTESKVA